MPWAGTASWSMERPGTWSVSKAATATWPSPASWRSGFDISQTAHDFAPFGGFYIVLEAGGSGTQVNILETGHGSYPLRWSLELGAMSARRYRDQWGLPPECEVGVDGCHVWHERRRFPMSRDGDRIYVLEELWLDMDGTGPAGLELQSQRANFYDIEAPPLD